MKQSKAHCTRTRSGHFERSALPANQVRPLIVAVLLTVCCFPMAMRAQAPASRELTLLLPQSADFDGVVAAQYPGLSEMKNYSLLRPYLAVLKNETNHTVRAYAVKWNIQTADGVQHPPRFIFFIQKHSLPRVDDFGFSAGEYRLLAPLLFNDSPRQYMLRKSHLPGDLELVLKEPPFAWLNPSQPAPAAVDAVIYGDGVYMGTDEFRLGTRYQALRAAEHDGATSALSVLASDSTQLSAALNSDVAAGLAVDTSPTGDTATLFHREYLRERGKQAQTMLRIQRENGEGFLKSRLQSIATRPQETLRPQASAK